MGTFGTPSMLIASQICRELLNPETETLDTWFHFNSQHHIYHHIYSNQLPYS